MHYLIIALLSLCALNTSVHASELQNQATHLGLIPHKALYSVKLHATRSGSQVVNIDGQMFYEWTMDCEAWNADHRFNILYEYADSPAQKITSNLSTFESFDGKTLSFTAQRKQNGDLFEEIRGQATINADGTGSAEHSKPKNLAYDLPQGTLFPMAHSIKALEMIKANKPFFNAIVFDGSDEDGPVEVNAIIAKAKSAPTPATFENTPAIEQSLLASPAHDVRLAFFPMKDSAETPDYEMTLTLHENSVISKMQIEYDDFTVWQELVALEPTPNACGQDIHEDKTNKNNAE